MALLIRPFRARSGTLLLLCAVFAAAPACGEEPPAIEPLPPLGPPPAHTIPQRLPAVSDEKPAHLHSPDSSFHPEKLQANTAPSVVGKSFSLADLEALAFAHNPTLAQSAADVSAASGRYLQATLPPNPTAGYQGEEMGDEDSAGQQGFFINQEFVRRQKRRLSRAAGSREVAYAQQAAAIQQLRVLNDVGCEHFNVLVGERVKVLAEQVHAISMESLDKTEQLYEAKFVPYHDVLQARIQSTTAHIAVGNAHNRYFAAWRRLMSLIGMPSLEARPLKGELWSEHTPLEWDTVLEQIYARSPQLARAYALVAWKRTLLAQSKTAVQPNLLAVVGMQQDTETNDLIGNVQLGWPIPLLNRNQGNIQEAYAELRKAELDIERTKLAIRSRLASTYEVYMNSWNEVNQYTQHILPDARAALDLVVRGYQQQQFDILTLLDAKRTFARANLTYLKSLQDLGVSHIVIEGSLLIGSLRENSQANTPEIDVSFSPAFGPGVIPVETDPGN